MKNLMENWRGYLNEGTDTTEHILDALEKFKDLPGDRFGEQLHALIDAFLGIENPQAEDLKDVLDVITGKMDQAQEDMRRMDALSRSQSTGQWPPPPKPAGEVEEFQDAMKRYDDALGKLHAISRYLAYKNPKKKQDLTQI